MNIVSTSSIQRGRISFGAARAGLAALGLIGLCSTAFAADKPPLAARYRSAVHHGFADFRDHRIWPAGAGERDREGHSPSARHHRRARELRASAGAFLEGQCQLRHLWLCRTFRGRLALRPRRPRLWLDADLRRRSKGRAPIVSPRVSMVRRKPVRPSRPRRARSSPTIGRLR